MPTSPRAQAQLVRAALPCSVAMPAGTGKTEIITALVAEAAECGERMLVLTHTNAGVDALRNRLRCHNVPPDAFRLDTIASWSHRLVRQYPIIAGMTVPAIPDWKASNDYYLAAAAVAEATFMRASLVASYTFVVIDEYQDCSLAQHALVTQIAATLPTAVLGDPLQAVFHWEGLPSWTGQVQPLFPPLSLDIHPWRWADHHHELGAWLLAIRQNFDHGQPIVLDDASPVRWTAADSHQIKIRTCRALRTEFPDDSIVAIGIRSADCLSIAGDLQGTFSAMETIEGHDMIDYARTVDTGTPAAVSAATAAWAKNCISNISAPINSSDVKRLAAGRQLTGLKRPGAEQAQRALDDVLSDTSPLCVARALTAIGELPGRAIYRHDAWFTVLRALTTCGSGTVADAVMAQRNRTRAAGRHQTRRTVSRTTLIKGLEYDHAIILDGDAHSPTSLYVALTRARKTLTIISRSTHLSTAPVAVAPKQRRTAPPWHQMTLVP